MLENIKTQNYTDCGQVKETENWCVIQRVCFYFFFFVDGMSHNITL